MIMKKLLFFVAAAALMAACSSEELANSGNKQDPNGDPINFSVYTPRSTTRAGVPGSIDNTSLKTGTHKDYGFGIFGYYTAGTTYDQNATPNFMYNQQVKYDGSNWKYEPVKYWPNEYGNAAISDDIDYVSFFAYAPWTQFTPSSGLPIITPIADYNTFANKLGLPGVTSLATYKNYIKATTDDAAKAALDALNVDFIQNKNITEISKNTATGDPIIKYVVDTNPAFSVDLLYGVAADNTSYSPINDVAGASAQNAAGKPFLNLVKPKVPATDKLNFYLQHALSKIKVTIDYIADAATPGGTSEDINPNYTRIYVRSITFGGFAMKGALNLNSTETMTVSTGTGPTNYTVGKPKWLSYDGTSELSINDITFFDGRKDGREGATNGAQNSETPVGLNPNIVENEGLVVAGTTAIPLTHWATADEATAANATEKTSGVTKIPQNVFGGVGDYFYVIPRNNNEPVDMTIVYDVETIDDNLAGKLSDNATHGSTIENVISKFNIFGAGIDFKPGYTYNIKIHIGMTSVKVDATVLPWTADNNAVVDLPDN